MDARAASPEAGCLRVNASCQRKLCDAVANIRGSTSCVVSLHNAQKSGFHESRNGPPPGFVFTSKAPADHQFKLRIALEQGDSPALIDALYAVSTPGNPKYGQHLSKDEVARYVTPRNESVQAVYGWLTSKGLTPRISTHSGDWMVVDVTVDQADALLEAQYNVYTEEETGTELIRTMNYTIPTALKEHITLVHPTLSFSRQRTHRQQYSAPLTTSSLDRRNEVAQRPNITTITPEVIQRIYNIPKTSATYPHQKLGVIGLMHEHANQADLESFLKKFRPDMDPSTSFSLQTLDGGTNPQDPKESGLEATMDLEYAIGIATGVPTVFVSVGTDFQDGALSGMLDTAHHFLAQEHPPQVISTSYGAEETDVSPALLTRLCNAYAQLGARGVSMIFASGDGGVTGAHLKGNCTRFAPTLPGGCPYITSVGATQLMESGREEGAWYSSGGFSDVFPVPAYQAPFVAPYIKRLGDHNAGRYNATGRGFPDVSFVGTSYTVAINGSTGVMDGTSASAPAFAGMIALLNDRLMSAGRSPMGFLNPFLYSKGRWTFLDVTRGNNPGTNLTHITGGCGTSGFSASPGWDPITGLGTPDFNKLLVAVGLRRP
ncbi:hypothetical protein EIP91_004467 [Steccherinum ochraceum]|uniref:tripeptidyl-peptidase II n=1 Tax=Steccherinum ochraceum TaxID=92696 RepID=A0A4R0R8V5_9APHY|nr:hypothetical protein EIP91_004467 [Steccherinum ochraceum]